jgi:membrane fusion protein, copper/silver efflux system
MNPQHKSDKQGKAPDGMDLVPVYADENAVISTGERNIVFVAKGGGMFEPREVILGARVRNLFEVKKGISEGEQVVTGANFLLDSESKLKAATSVVTGGHKHGS